MEEAIDILKSAENQYTQAADDFGITVSVASLKIREALRSKAAEISKAIKVLENYNKQVKN